MEREDRLRLEQQKLEWEQRETEMELRHKQKEAEKEMQQQAWKIKGDDDEREIRLRSTAARAKLFGDAMRNASVQMGSDPVDAIPFFENIEHLFNVFNPFSHELFGKIS
jgi:predicted Holliday junction resolvase-like endonuclease